MYLNLIRPSAMLLLSSTWMKELRQIFLSIVEIAGLMPRVEAAHVKLETALEAAKANNPTTRITEEMTATDYGHDNSVRALYHLLNAVICYLLAVKPARADELEQFRALLARLMPEGTGYTIKSYSEESGAALVMMKQLDVITRKQLEQVLFFDTNALEVALLWGRMGEELGWLEQKRGLIEGEQAETPAVRDAKKEWIKVVAAVMNALDVSVAPAGNIGAIRTPILDELAKAEARNARSKKSSATKTSATSTTSSSMSTTTSTETSGADASGADASGADASAMATTPA